MKSTLRIEYFTESGEQKEFVCDIKKTLFALSSVQFKQLVKILVKKGNSLERKYRVTKKALGQKPGDKRKLDPLYFEKSLVLQEVLELPPDLLEIVLNSAPYTFAIFQEFDFLQDFSKLNHFKSHKPSLFFGLAKGPKDSLHSTSFLELDVADKYLAAYQKTRDKKYFYYLFAWLYKPMGLILPDWLQKMWVLILRICCSRYTQQLCVLNFVGLRNNFSSRFPLTFSRFSKEKDLGTNYGFLGMVVAMAGEKFGLPKQVEKTDCNLVFIGIEKNNEQAERLKQD